MNDNEYLQLISSGIIKELQEKIIPLKVTKRAYDKTYTLKSGEIRDYKNVQRQTYVPAALDKEGVRTLCILEEDLIKIIEVLVGDNMKALVINNLLGLTKVAENEPVHVDEPAPKKEEKIVFIK